MGVPLEWPPGYGMIRSSLSNPNINREAFGAFVDTATMLGDRTGTGGGGLDVGGPNALAGTLAGSIITAAGLWHSDEGHFGDHRFWIQVYRYGNYYKTFHKVLGFTTLKKYPSEQMTVIDRELGTVLKLMKYTYGGRNPMD